jgi:hypothetical protein
MGGRGDEMEGAFSNPDTLKASVAQGVPLFWLPTQNLTTNHL